MSLKSWGYMGAYFFSGTILIEMLRIWISFKSASVIGMTLCFLVSILSKFKMGWLLVLGSLHCLLLYLDHAFSVFGISDAKQSDWVAVIGSGVLFSAPGILGLLVSKGVRICEK